MYYFSSVGQNINKRRVDSPGMKAFWRNFMRNFCMLLGVALLCLLLGFSAGLYRESGEQLLSNAEAGEYVVDYFL